jgi:hypothetical protein
MSDPHTIPAPRGKRCTRCLCCDAEIIFDGEALCAACDDGTHPALPEQRVSSQLSALSSQPNPEPDTRANALVVRFNERDNSMTIRTRSVHPSGTQTVADTSPAPLPTEGYMKRAKPEIEEAIRKAGPDEPAGDLAARLKNDIGTVYYFRAKIRRQVQKSGAKPVLAARNNNAERAKNGNAAQRATRAIASWPITLNVSVETMDKWFKSLPDELKATIFSNNYEFNLEGIAS